MISQRDQLLLLPLREQVGRKGRFGDCRKYSLDIRHDIMVPKAHHPESLRSEPGIAQSVAFFSLLTAIDLDNQPLGKTNKVDDVASDRELSAETQSVELLRANGSPNQLFCRSRVFAQEVNSAISHRPLLLCSSRKGRRNAVAGHSADGHSSNRRTEAVHD